jgi:hypothetical protein
MILTLKWWALFITLIFLLIVFQCTHIGLADNLGYDKLWARSLPSDETQNDDPYNIGHWCYALFSHWVFHFTATLNVGNETEIRSGSDYLFRLAFQLQSGWKHRMK